ncbi:sugar phosphate isomerase/epimerase family protein [Emergencia timonensis]
MARFKFGAVEWAFPCWGELAIKMASEAGFSGMQLGDGGGSLQGYPLRNKRVQEYYLNAGAKYNIEFPHIHLYTLGHQGYFRSSLDSEEGKICLESIRQGVIAASEMGIPTVVIDGMRMNNAAKKQHVLDVCAYAVKMGAEYGVNIAMETDMELEDHITFLDQFDGKLTLCFDTHNPCMYGTGYPPEMIRVLGQDRIDHFHIKDNGGNQDGYVNVESPLVPFGTGITYFEEAARAVKDIGFEGWLISENMYYHKSMMKGMSSYIQSARRDVAALYAAYGEE